jgi:hypothetical protein
MVLMIVHGLRATPITVAHAFAALPMVTGALVLTPAEVLATAASIAMLLTRTTAVGLGRGD